MAWCLFGAKPSPEPMLIYSKSKSKSKSKCCKLDTYKKMERNFDEHKVISIQENKSETVCWQIVVILFQSWCVNTLRTRQNGRRFADDTFKRIFVNKNVRIFIEISLKFVPKVPINNIPALVQILAWRRSGDKPLSEPMMVSLLTHICVTRPQSVNEAPDTYGC